MKADGIDYGLMSGHVFKHRQIPQPCTWQVPSAVGTAVAVAKQLMSTNRIEIAQRLEDLKQQLKASKTKQGKSFQTFAREAEFHTRNLKSLFVSGGARRLRVTALSRGSIQRDLSSFARRIILSDAAGAPFNPSPAQFRTTFASFIAAHSLGNLRYLQHHFSHLSLDMTAHYARGSQTDETLIELVEEFRDQLKESIVATWMNTDSKLSGAAGQRIMNTRPQFLKSRCFDNFADLSASISSEIDLRSTGHSWCLGRGLSCGGVGLYDAIACVGCSNGVIDESHKNIWSRLREHQKELIDANEGVSITERAAAHLRACDKVLSELAGTK
jgi:hypothetical protein